MTNLVLDAKVEIIELFKQRCMLSERRANLRGERRRDVLTQDVPGFVSCKTILGAQNYFMEEKCYYYYYYCLSGVQLGNVVRLHPIAFSVNMALHYD